jgi:hypothetical protein
VPFLKLLWCLESTYRDETLQDGEDGCRGKENDEEYKERSQIDKSWYAVISQVFHLISNIPKALNLLVFVKLKPFLERVIVLKKVEHDNWKDEAEEEADIGWNGDLHQRQMDD